MKIVQLVAENIKRLSAVEITPEGSLITVGGLNGAGKSSVLDAIAYALGGNKLVPEEPIRHGETEAKVVLDLGEFVVTRKFWFSEANEVKSSLTVTNADGAKYPSPQAMLDKLLGKLSFDPLEFARAEPKAQRDILVQLVNLDTSILDDQHREAYSFRTHFNREVLQLKARVDGMPHHAEAPEQEVSIDAISQRMLDAEHARQAVAEAKRKHERALDSVHALTGAERLGRETVEELRKKLAEAEQRLVNVQDRIVVETVEVDKFATEVARLEAEVPATDVIREELAAAERTNAQVRENRLRAEALAALDTATAKAKEQDQRLVDLAARKAELIGSVQYPVEGLGVSETGVTFNDVPLKQASTAEQIRVSVAIGLALNPKLKVLLVRSGNDLDSRSMKAVAEQAETAGAQIWVERVAEQAGGVTVMIEDGHVA
jgi:DNA repair exonuclease SbcCD ATPase subunit